MIINCGFMILSLMISVQYYMITVPTSFVSQSDLLQTVSFNDNNITITKVQGERITQI